MKRWLAVVSLVAVTALAGTGHAQPPPTPPVSSAPSAGAPHAAAQGVAVLSAGASRDDTFTLARAVYATRLRPAALDELHARILAGDQPPPDAPPDVRELAELRGAIAGEDAASRRVLASIAQQLGVEALLLVRGGAPEPAASPPKSTWGGADGGADVDAGAAPLFVVPLILSGPLEARLFLASSGELDAARYAPEPGVAGALGWRATVASLERRFGTAGPVAATSPVPPPVAKPQTSETRPFYASPWFWGALGGALLVGGVFYFATRDTSDQPIHLQMHVPH
jgi:hypothetical protein